MNYYSVKHFRGCLDRGYIVPNLIREYFVQAPNKELVHIENSV